MCQLNVVPLVPDSPPNDDAFPEQPLGYMGALELEINTLAQSA
jgi:hypothetical protein